MEGHAVQTEVDAAAERAVEQTVGIFGRSFGGNAAWRI